ncbi:MAG: hypothetical protein BGO56_00455 [Sphingobacteriales bacterium 48-107]|jgi:hypothetical protein|nr:MAG: hypothetical protein BGO56_00455 [Sphingobacteriales bacterium 48-107]
MKKLKLNLFMAAALAIAAVTMSFKMAEKSNAREASGKLVTYVFTLNPGGSFDQASDYSFSPSGTSCEEGSEVCAVSNTQNNVLTQPELDAILAETDPQGQIYWRN